MGQYELLVANISGSIRREIHNGRQHIVVPLSLLKEGVLNGSKGPLFYPHSEISKGADSWNGMPIVVNHPTDGNGNAVSARSPKVLERFGIGTVFNAKTSDKLRAEGWFDVEHTRRIDSRILNSLEKAEKVELSTGLFTDNVPVENDKEHSFEGKSYTAIARNYQPDHLAILFDKKGACSIKDGCGVNNEVTQDDLADYKIDWDLLRNGGDPKHTKPQWFELISTSQKSTVNSKETDMTKLTKEQMVKNLIANADLTNGGTANKDGPWSEEDNEGLTTLNEEKVEKLHTQLLAANALPEALKKANEAAKKKKKAETGDGDDEGEANDDDEGGGKPTKNANVPVIKVISQNAEPKKPQTMDDLLKTASPELQSVVTNLLATQATQKEALIKSITANEKNTFTDEYLQAASVQELQGFAALCGCKQETGPVANYTGQGQPQERVDNADFRGQDSDMAPAAMDWTPAATS